MKYHNGVFRDATINCWCQTQWNPLIVFVLISLGLSAHLRFFENQVTAETHRTLRDGGMAALGIRGLDAVGIGEGNGAG